MLIVIFQNDILLNVIEIYDILSNNIKLIVIMLNCNAVNIMQNVILNQILLNVINVSDTLQFDEYESAEFHSDDCHYIKRHSDE
jgi:hypothetical protein